MCVLASGSKGNATYISDGNTSILIDAGLSGKELQRRMALRELSPESIDAIIISHEHSDHIKGAGILSRRFKLPVFINEKTYKASESNLGALNEKIIIECGTSFNVNTLTVHPFSVSHDAADPAGFVVSQNGIKIGIATDLGIANLIVKERLKSCNVLIIECNHDPVMLMANNSYPEILKQRVKSRKGHLANQDTRNLIEELMHDKLSHIILAHLSEENNTPERAYDEVLPALNGNPIHLFIAGQNEPGDVIRIFPDHR